MTEIDWKKVTESISGLWKKEICPICQSKDSYQVVGGVYELREYNQGNFIISKKTNIVPLVPVICDKCGHTFLFNAITLGIVGDKNENKNKGQS